MMMTSSAVSAISLMRWLETKTVRPSDARRRSSRRTHRLGGQSDDPGPRRAVTGPEARSGPISVILVDDQPLLRKGFRMVLEEEPGIVVVARPPTARPRSTSLAATTRTSW